MSQVHEAVAELTSAVTDKVRELSNTKGELLSIASDVRHAFTTGEALETREQRIYAEVTRQYWKDPEGTSSLMYQCANDLGKKDITIISNAGGGFGLPKTLAARIDRLASTVNPWLDDTMLGVTEVNTSDFHVPMGLSDVSGSSRATSETAARAATSTPTFRDQKPVFGEYFAYCTISNNAREDVPNLENFLMEEFAAQIGSSLASDIWSGTGSNGQVLGFATTTPVTTSDAASPMRAANALQYGVLAGATLVVADIKNLLSLFQESYLLDPSFSLVMRPSTWYKTVLGATDGPTDAMFLMKNPPTFGPYPVKLTSAAPAVGSNAFAIVAAAWKRAYTLVSRGPMMVTVDAVSVPGQTKYWARARYGAGPRANNAAKLLKFATS